MSKVLWWVQVLILCLQYWTAKIVCLMESSIWWVGGWFGVKFDTRTAYSNPKMFQKACLDLLLGYAYKRCIPSLMQFLKLVLTSQKLVLFNFIYLLILNGIWIPPNIALQYWGQFFVCKFTKHDINLSRKRIEEIFYAKNHRYQ
jgi:hypothetical protein